MATTKQPPAEERRSSDDSIMAGAEEDHNKVSPERKANAAIKAFIGFLNQDRCVGDLISMDYDTAEVLIHDRLRQDVGGVPHGCFLLATRIKPDDDTLNLLDAQSSLILLRTLKASPLPNDIEMKQARLEAGQRAAQTDDNWDEGGKTDQFTLDQMRYAGAHCRILGTFRMRLDEEATNWSLEYGGDIDNFYAGQGMKVYKPNSKALEGIVNYTLQPVQTASQVEIGSLCYAASALPNATENVPVCITAEDFIAQRTALFGMTRTGKSNTTKTIASAIFRLRTLPHERRVGQLIFDPNGEYANENPQDQGCLRNVENMRPDLKEDVVTYGLTPHPNDPDRKITKFNFFGRMPSWNSNKQGWDDALHSLYQGKQLIDDILREEDAGYITGFVSTDIVAPEDIEKNHGENVRYRRALFFYKSILVAAGFTPPEQPESLDGLFSKDLRNLMRQSESMLKYVGSIESDQMPWDQAKNFAEDMAGWVKETIFKNFDKKYKNGQHTWSDSRLLGLLNIFDNTRGLNLMRQALQWHNLDSSTDYIRDIIDHIREGRLVIFDQALGTPSMNKQVSDRIAKGIFAAQQEAFISPEIDAKTKQFKPPPPVIIYVEEAHTILPKGSETDITNIWARIAKEGAKFQIGLVYSTQEPSAIQSNILKNTENWFIAHLNNTDETLQLKKYNDFSDFVHSITKVNKTGFLRVRTRSNPYTLPVQIARFTAPAKQT